MWAGPGPPLNGVLKHGAIYPEEGVGGMRKYSIKTQLGSRSSVLAGRRGLRPEGLSGQVAGAGQKDWEAVLEEGPCQSMSPRASEIFIVKALPSLILFVNF